MRTQTTLVALFVLLAAVAAGAAPKWHQLTADYSFAQYKADFGKAYATDAEHAMRAQLFAAALKAALAHNADKTASFKKGVNELSDRTDAEFQKRNGGKAIQMHALKTELRKQAHVKTHAHSGLAAPDTVDYRLAAPQILSAVKDQGDCGSCWAHAATENLESHWAIKTGQMYALSQQQFTACAPNPNQCGGTGGCMGSIAELAYDYLAKFGKMAAEWAYPYTAFYGTTGKCMLEKNTTGMPVSVVQVSGYTAVTPNSVADVMDALAHTGPLAVNVDASHWQGYESGIFSGCNMAKNISIDHVVQLVGYGTDLDLKADYWIIRNSWTPAWGENGYIRLIKHSKAECGWNVQPQNGVGCKGGPAQQWTCGQCGVLFDTVYPNVVAK
jgi:cathepsin L